MQRPDVLVVGTSVDPHVAAVLERLPRSLAVCRLDVDRYPREQQLTVRPGTKHRVELHSETTTWLLDSVPVAWFRRLGQPGLSPQIPDEHRAFALGEVEQALTGALDLIRPVHWINEYWAARRAAVKLSQFETIHCLEIPTADLVVTNRALAASAWLRSGGPAVYKSLNSPLLEIGDGSSPRRFVFTSPVSAEDLLDSEAIALSPCQFQRQLFAEFELRVTSIGSQHFAVRIDHEPWHGSESSDWRAHPERLTNSIYDLPASVADQLTKLLAALGLEYGASDWIVTRDGRHVLLEVNPHGAWLWLDNEIDELDITGALAQTIADRVGTTTV